MCRFGSLWIRGSAFKSCNLVTMLQRQVIWAVKDTFMWPGVTKDVNSLVRDMMYYKA